MSRPEESDGEDLSRRGHDLRWLRARRDPRDRAPDAAVSIDLAKGLVKVDGAIADADIRAAVQDAGFTYEGAAA